VDTAQNTECVITPEKRVNHLLVVSSLLIDRFLLDAPVTNSSSLVAVVGSSLFLSQLTPLILIWRLHDEI
jgi:hypothetical protein